MQCQSYLHTCEYLSTKIPLLNIKYWKLIENLINHSTMTNKLPKYFETLTAEFQTFKRRII